MDFGFSFFVNVQWLHTGPYPGYGGGVLGPDQRCIQRVRCSGQVKRPGSPVLFSVLGRGLFFFAILGVSGVKGAHALLPFAAHHG